jgi:Phospholipase_D-nuclease N-terminal/Short C-terminal domain
MVLAADWAVGEVLWTMIWFTLFFLWIWLVISVFADIFRSDDMGGWAKAFWCLFVILLPYLGVFVYLIARGDKMRHRAVADAQAQDAARRAYIQDAAGTASSPAAEVERLASLRAQGVIDDAEFQQLKTKAIA